MFIVSGEKLSRPGLLPETLIFFFFHQTKTLSVFLCFCLALTIWHVTSFFCLYTYKNLNPIIPQRFNTLGLFICLFGYKLWKSGSLLSSGPSVCANGVHEASVRNLVLVLLTSAFCCQHTMTCWRHVCWSEGVDLQLTLKNVHICTPEHTKVITAQVIVYTCDKWYDSTPGLMPTDLILHGNVNKMLNKVVKDWI